MAEQRVNQLRQQLDDRRSGRGGRGGGKEDKTNTGSTPEGRWQNGGCEGEKIANYEKEDGSTFSFLEGQAFCEAEVEANNYNSDPGFKNTCCRCDRGDGES